MGSPGGGRRATTPKRPTAPSKAPARLALRVVVPALGCLSCGGAAPLMHPAHVLESGQVSGGAGISGRFASRASQRAIDRGRAAAEGNLDDPATARAYATGVLTDALLAPGASPFVALRVGLPERTEAGMTYTGRSLRLDGRYALTTGQWAASLGLGATLLLETADSDSAPRAMAGAGPAQTELDAGGWGIDVPVIAGYRSLGQFVDLWAGARFGYERLSGELNVQRPDAGPWTAEGSRWWAGTVMGMAVGVPPVWLHLEIDTTFHRLDGELSPADAARDGHWPVERSGWTLSPSAGLVGKF